MNVQPESARDRLLRYHDAPSGEGCELSREELAGLDPEDFPVGRAVRVEVLHPEPGGPLVTRELSRRGDGRLVLLVDVYARRRYWGAEVPLRAYFRRVHAAVRERGDGVLLLASQVERRHKKAHLSYLIPSPTRGSALEQYEAMAAVDEALRSPPGSG